MEIIEEKNYKIKTNKNNEMDLILSNINNEELSININKNQTIKYELKCNLEEFQKNRFFKIFINIQEIMKELETKIEKSTFIEETNLIIMDIQIGLTIINEIFLIIDEREKNKDEIIKEFEKTVNELKNELNKKDKIIEESERIRKLKEEEEDELINNDNKLEKKINELILIRTTKEEEKAKKEELELKSYLLVI